MNERPVGLAGGALQLQHYLAAKAHVLAGNGDGVPRQAALLALLNGGFGILELKLLGIFFLLQLEQGLHPAQLFLNGIRLGVGQARGSVSCQKSVVEFVE